jgi:hypothetical protein
MSTKDKIPQKLLSAEQMLMLGRLGMDFIGWQQGSKEQLFIFANDRDSNNATYAFCSNAAPDEILSHVVEKRKQLRGDGHND